MAKLAAVILLVAGIAAGGSVYIGASESSTNAPWCGI